MASTRRSRKNTLPKATLERARQQAGLEPEADVEENEAEESEVTPRQARAASSRRSGNRGKVTTMAQVERARARGEIDQEMVRDLLANPIVTVSEEELHSDYGRVLVDLRNMGLLSAALIVLLIFIAVAL